MNTQALISRALLCSMLLFGQTIKADVIDTPTGKTLSTRNGSPTLTLPKLDWRVAREQNRPDGTAVYYHLVSDSTQLNFSVYIDKTTACQTAEACLQAALKNESYKEAKELQQSTVGPFKLAQFFLDQPLGFPVKQAHILASAYVGGHWFDVHISNTGPERPSPVPLLELLKSVTLR
jgi:hypothetical protein